MKVAHLAAPALLLSLVQAGCVNRTVYVVDDRDDAPVPATARATASAEPPPRYEDDAGIHRVDDFYEPLSPYGRWVSTPAYGMVFVPSAAVVGVGFRPYTHGHWVNTEWGWTWVDHHPFGWATGHYGRWYFDASYGWVWVPGTVWAPAWVSWRTGGGYVGWAPMPPGAVFGGVYTVYDTSWVFVSYSSMGVAYVGNALIVGPAYRSCYVSTSPYRETYVVYGRTYYRGPREDEVVRAGGHVVHRPIRELDDDRAVTRPPAASSRDREDADGRTRGRPDRGGSRSDDATGAPRDRDDERGGRDDGATGGSRGRDDERGGRDDGATGGSRGRDGIPGDEGRGDDGRGRGDGRIDGRGDDGRGRPVDRPIDRGQMLDGVTPAIDPAAGPIGERGETGVGVPERDGVGVGRGERDPVDGERDEPGRGRTPPALGTPWRDDRRPTGEDAEDPEHFRRITDPLGERSPPSGAGRPVEPRPDPRADSRVLSDPSSRVLTGPDSRLGSRPQPERGPTVDRSVPDARTPAMGGRPSNPERAPRVQPDRGPAPGVAVPQPSSSDTPSAEQPTQGKKDGKKSGKKSKPTPAASPKKR